MIEVDGPPSAWFEDVNGNRHPYIAYALMSATAAELVYLYHQWRRELEAANPHSILVWRRRPTWASEMCDDQETRWKLSYRCVVVSSLWELGTKFPVHEEGAIIPVL